MKQENILEVLDALGAMLENKNFEIMTQKVVVNDLRKKLEAAEEKIAKLQAEKDGILCAREVKGAEVTE